MKPIQALYKTLHKKWGKLDVNDLDPLNAAMTIRLALCSLAEEQQMRFENLPFMLMESAKAEDMLERVDILQTMEERCLRRIEKASLKKTVAHQVKFLLKMKWEDMP
jgi:hypothetical protein